MAAAPQAVVAEQVAILVMVVMVLALMGKGEAVRAGEQVAVLATNLILDTLHLAEAGALVCLELAPAA